MREKTIVAKVEEWFELMTAYHDAVLGWVGGNQKLDGAPPTPEHEPHGQREEHRDRDESDARARPLRHGLGRAAEVERLDRQEVRCRRRGDDERAGVVAVRRKRRGARIGAR